MRKLNFAVMIQTALKYCIIILGLTAFWACEPCTDCGPDNTSPYFNLKIINKTSLDTLTQYQSRITAEISAVNTALKDSKNASKADSLNKLKTIKTDSLTLVKALITTINKGSISIESINGKTKLFENRNGGDTLDRFRIPLNTNQTESEYNIKIGYTDSTHSLKLSYQLQDTTINSKITKSAFNLKVTEHHFDSLRGPYGCSPLTECTSNKLEIYVEI